MPKFQHFTIDLLHRMRVTSDRSTKRDELIIPIRVLPEPDLPDVHLPRGGWLQTTEDSDLILQGLAIVERDGIYETGEMEGAIVIPDLDALDSRAVAHGPGVSWQGKVRRKDDSYQHCFGM